MNQKQAKVKLLIALTTFASAQARLADSLGDNRRVLGGGRINDTFCALDSESQCHWGDYALALFAIGLPFLILAILSLVSLLVFVIGRFCFNAFGGKKRNTKAFFLGRKNGEKESFDLKEYKSGVQSKDDGGAFHFQGYPRWQILFVQIGLVVLLLGFIICLIVGIVGNSKVHSGLDSSINLVSSTANDLSAKLNNIVRVINTIPIESPLNNVTAEMTSLASRTNSVGDEAQSAKNKWEPLRFALTILFLVLPIVVIGLGIAGGLFNAPKVVMAAALLSFVMSFFLWLMFAGYISVSIISNDACSTGRPFVSNLRSLPSDQVPDQPIPQFVACSNGATFANYRRLAAQTQSTVRGAICNVQTQICSAQGQTCSTTCTQGDYQTSLNQVVNDNSGRFTIEQCASSCSNNNLKTASATMIQLVTASQQFDSVYENDLLPLIDCSIINSVIDQTLTQVCGPTSSGADTIAIIFLVLALLNVFATIMLILAFKRWRKGNLRTTIPFGEAPPSPSQRYR